MFRVFDTEDKKWVKENVYLDSNDDLFLIKHWLFGAIKSIKPLYQDRYVYHEDIELYDKDNTLIFIGDWLKAQISEDKSVLGLVVYSNELSSYIILCDETSEFYSLGIDASPYIKVVGNVFDGLKEDEENEQAL